MFFPRGSAHVLHLALLMMMMCEGSCMSQLKLRLHSPATYCVIAIKFDCILTLTTDMLSCAFRPCKGPAAAAALTYSHMRGWISEYNFSLLFCCLQSGSHAELLEAGGVYASLVKRQISHRCAAKMPVYRRHALCCLTRTSVPTWIWLSFLAWPAKRNR